MIIIKKVTLPKELDAFIKFPWKIYPKASNWVPQLISDQQKMLDVNKSEFLKNNRHQLFLALDRNNQVVGRIATCIHQKHIEIYKDDRGFFGFFECIDNQAVANALLDAAKNWLSENNMKHMRGPMSFTINDDIGLLIEGFEYLPCVGMPYNHAYYANLFDTYGLIKEKDLIAYQFDFRDLDQVYQKRVLKIIDSNQKKIKNKLTFKPLNINDPIQDAQFMEKVYTESWQDNWGAVPLTDKEFIKICDDYRPFMDERLMWIISYEGQVAGIMIAFPDIYPALKKANGRLFPFGLIKFLWAKRKINSFRLLLLGILKQYQNLGIEQSIFHKIYTDFLPAGYTNGEFSWILEDNIKMNRSILRTGAKPYKKYRVYGKNFNE